MKRIIQDFVYGSNDLFNSIQQNSIHINIHIVDMPKE